MKKDPKKDDDSSNMGKSSTNSRKTSRKKKGEEEANQEVEELIRAFRVFDEDKDGKIPNGDFRYLLERLGFKFPRAFVDKIFQIEGLEEDGEIDYIEFVNKWKDVPVPADFQFKYCVETDDSKSSMKKSNK